MAQDAPLPVCLECAIPFVKTDSGVLAAIACNIAKDANITRAVRAACRYVDAGIKTSFDLGQGSGPINHFHSVQTLPFSS